MRKENHQKLQKSRQWSNGSYPEISKFELQSHFYVHFRTNTEEKGMNPLNQPTLS